MNIQKINSTQSFGMLVQVRESRIKRDLGPEALKAAQAAANELRQQKEKALIIIDRGSKTVSYDFTNPDTGIISRISATVPTNDISASAINIKGNTLTLGEKIKLFFSISSPPEFKAKSPTAQDIKNAATKALIELYASA